ncbi:hypothetical protein HK104_010505 [Borealophlyctis nickersoniae]|nr:hypothetical protein HK104_010505 [Borealophlyctis nickersoniae]
MAVHAIVQGRLYKAQGQSLESYFRNAYKISRAQVYRFMDCAIVLQQLEGFAQQPCRERLCRSLKRLAKNRHDIRKLWTAVLASAEGEAENVTSTQIDASWQELMEKGEVTGVAEVLFEMGFQYPKGVSVPSVGGKKKAASALGNNKHTNRRQIEAHTPSGNSPMDDGIARASLGDEVAESANNGATQTPLVTPQGLASGPAMGVPTTEQGPSVFFEALRSVHQRGYVLQPFVNGRWIESQVQNWRLVPAATVVSLNTGNEGGGKLEQTSADKHEVDHSWTAPEGTTQPAHLPKQQITRPSGSNGEIFPSAFANPTPLSLPLADRHTRVVEDMRLAPPNATAADGGSNRTQQIKHHQSSNEAAVAAEAHHTGFPLPVHRQRDSFASLCTRMHQQHEQSRDIQHVMTDADEAAKGLLGLGWQAATGVGKRVGTFGQRSTN